MTMDIQHVKKICKIGEGSRCCRYLVAGKGGFECAKLVPSLSKVLDTRVEAKTMVATAINCDGYTEQSLNKEV